MISRKEIVKVLDLESNQAIDMSLHELYMRKIQNGIDRFMVKDRFGWTHVTNIQEYPNPGFICIIQPNAPNTSSITVSSDHIIPVYNGKFTSGFHGVACYENKPHGALALARILETSKVWNHLPSIGPMLLLNAETNRFYEFCIMENKDHHFVAIDIQTKSGYIDINGFSLAADDKYRDIESLYMECKSNHQ